MRSWRAHRRRTLIGCFNVRFVKVLISLRNVAPVYLVAVILLCLSSTVIVSADVPTVQKVEASREGENTLLYIEIRHSSPSSTHYIDTLDVEINERLDRPLVRVTIQTSTVFNYTYDIGDVQYETIRVRAHCNVHGWGSWTRLGEQPETPFIETPLGMATTVGGVIVVAAAILIVLKKSGKM